MDGQEWPRKLQNWMGKCLKKNEIHSKWKQNQEASCLCHMLLSWSSERRIKLGTKPSLTQATTKAGTYLELLKTPDKKNQRVMAYPMAKSKILITLNKATDKHKIGPIWNSKQPFFTPTSNLT